MKSLHTFSLLIAPLLCAFSPSLAAADAHTAQNPIIWADVPDPAVIRVGDTYYMTSTTMHMSPGLPIMRSTDLINWRLIGYAYDILEDSDALALRNGANAYGGGSWASSLRFHDGVFYATTFSNNTGKTHVYTTRDIEHGPWKAVSFTPKLHDHSLHFEDDGRVFMVHGSGDLRLTELTSDVSAIKPGGINQIIIPNASLVAGANIGLPAEGSQLRKINGKYYLFTITWPKGGMRTQLIFRSDKLTGPYEGKVFLADRGVAQGGLIDTPDGKWYALLFQDHGAVGRVPFLVPVEWQDGWPVAVNGRSPDTLNISPTGNDSEIQNETSLVASGLMASDEFEWSPGGRALPLAWQWNHNPDNAHWTLTQRRGFLRLVTGRIDTDLLAARNTLTQRTFGPACAAITSIDVSNMLDGDCAGLAVFQKKYGFVGVRKSDTAKSLVMISAESGEAEEIESIPLSTDIIYLKAECDYRNQTDNAFFYYSLDGKKWMRLGQPLHMVYTLPHFMGYRFALFNYATKSPGGFVDFNYFRVSTP